MAFGNNRFGAGLYDKYISEYYKPIEKEYWIDFWNGESSDRSVPLNIALAIVFLFYFVLHIILTLVLIVVDVIVFLVGAIYDFARLIADFFIGLFSGFNETDDDNARALIARLSRGGINALTDEQLTSLTVSLLDGPTTTDDERALIKIVSYLNCSRLIDFYWPRFGDEILSDTDYDEFDELRVSLLRCGLINFSDWDDDATRIFIRRNGCDTLSLLRVGDVKILLRNLFSGSTGDDDERMINKLVNCLPDNVVQDLVAMRGFSVDDFDDSVDGREWDTLKRIFRSKGVRV